jgi:hypothetical protein
VPSNGGERERKEKKFISLKKEKTLIIKKHKKVPLEKVGLFSVPTEEGEV